MAARQLPALSDDVTAASGFDQFNGTYELITHLKSIQDKLLRSRELLSGLVPPELINISSHNTHEMLTGLLRLTSELYDECRILAPGKNHDNVGNSGDGKYINVAGAPAAAPAAVHDHRNYDQSAMASNIACSSAKGYNKRIPANSNPHRSLTVSASGLRQSPFSDKHIWRKYGEKPIKSSNHKRSYYRCAHSKTHACPAKQYRQKRGGDDKLEMIFINRHTCGFNMHHDSAVYQHDNAVDEYINLFNNPNSVPYDNHHGQLDTDKTSGDTPNSAGSLIPASTISGAVTVSRGINENDREDNKMIEGEVEWNDLYLVCANINMHSMSAPIAGTTIEDPCSLQNYSTASTESSCSEMSTDYSSTIVGASNSNWFKLPLGVTGTLPDPLNF